MCFSSILKSVSEISIFWPKTDGEKWSRIYLLLKSLHVGNHLSFLHKMEDFYPKLEIILESAPSFCMRIQGLKKS